MKSRIPSNSSRQPYSTDGAKWRAVQHRSPLADGHFVFGVATTGVYCRPSCASTRALRRNVSFYASPSDAERAGFRPCKRCQPERKSIAEEQAAAIARACRFIEHAEESLSLDELAKAANMSCFHFHRLFKRVTGVTPKAFAKANRSGRVRNELKRGRSVTDAIYASGFKSSGRFYAESRRMLGMKPSDFRSGAANETIRYAVDRCSLGPILVAASDKGICAVLLGDDRAGVTEELRRLFPKAKRVVAKGTFARTVRAVIRLVEKPRLGLDLPLDLRGTAFQQRVWQALQKIPAGETATYAEIARRMGAPKASRAVGAACGANAIAVAVPCHRVVSSGGNLTGYRWGTERKKTLLRREAA